MGGRKLCLKRIELFDLRYLQRGRLIVNTSLTADPSGSAANSCIGLGTGDDLASVNGTITSYKIHSGGNNDSLAINAVATNANLNGAAGADLIVINANVFGGQIVATGSATATLATHIPLLSVLTSLFPAPHYLLCRAPR